MEHEDDFMAGASSEGRGRCLPFDHVPVMSAEIIETLASVPAGVVLDATVGGGGHSAALLSELDHIEVIGLDVDSDAIGAALDRLAPYGSRAQVVRSRFDRLGEVLNERTIVGLSGFLFDLGISSPQVDRAERGFSYQRGGPLDMRMDRRQTVTAELIVNRASETELVGLLRRLGDERFAGRIAAAIVEHRPLITSERLAEVVVEAIPASERGGRHPARKTFQALRIAVNVELEVLELGLAEATRRLLPGGRGVVIAYHSGEDRIVKRHFAELTDDQRDQAPDVVEPPEPEFSLLWRGSRKPSEAEVAANPRASSARMRAIERRAA